MVKIRLSHCMIALLSSGHTASRLQSRSQCSHGVALSVIAHLQARAL